MRQEKGLQKPMSTRVFLLWSMISLLIVFNTANASEAVEDELGFVNLSLEELLDLEVTSGSKTKELVSDAPAAITMYKRKDLDMLGYYNLSDLANITPGYSSYTIFGEKVLETRGQKAGSFNNNKHLLFIDGIPVNHARNYKANIDNELPLYFADQVEFLRGPASALYGVGAFFGVISVDPITLSEPGQIAEGKITYGGPDHIERSMGNYVYRDEKSETAVSFGTFQKEASQDFTGPFPDPDNLFWDDQDSLFLYGRHTLSKGPMEGLTLGFITMKKETGLGEHWNGIHGGSSVVNNLAWEQIIPYVKMKRAISDSVTLDGYAKVNASQEAGTYADSSRASGVSEYQADVLSKEVMMEGRYDSDLFSAILGINYDTRSEELVGNGIQSADFAGNVETTSVFTQLQKEFPVLAGLAVTLGARMDQGKASKSGDKYDQVSPRFNLSQRLTDRWKVRYSYGEAIRSPGLKEYGLNNESQPMISSTLATLVPETMKSHEIGLSYSTPRFIGNVTAFKNITANALNGVRVESQNAFANDTGNTGVTGFEIAATYLPKDNIKLFGNYSFADGEYADGNDLTDVPSAKATLGINHQGRGPFKLSSTLLARWVEGYTTATKNDTEPDGYTVVDLRFVGELNKHSKLELDIRNLFNKTYRLPYGGIDQIPMPGTTAMLSLDIHF